MTTVATIHVYGEEEAIAALEHVSAAIRADVREATKRAAIDTQTLAKRLCPVDTGRLRSSIQYRDVGDWKEAEVFTNVEYAGFVEFGTRYMQPEPYLGPAWEQIRPYYLADLVGIMRSAGRIP